MIWKESLKIGVEEVDKQHKELFNRLNKFLKIVRNQDTTEIDMGKVEETLNFMGEYVDVHFKSEEAIQKKYNYPGYEEHREIHENFKQEIREFKQEFEEKDFDEELLMEFSGRLLTWLINHVASEDQKIAEYVTE